MYQRERKGRGRRLNLIIGNRHEKRTDENREMVSGKGETRGIDNINIRWFNL